MAETNALTIENARSIGLPTTTEWKAMLMMGGDLVGTGFLPTHIKTREQAAAIMLRCQELGIPMMRGLAGISMVNGKTTLDTEVMLALIYHHHGKQAIRVKHTDNERATIEYRLDGWEGTQELTFSIEDAKKANLLGKGGPWTAYPAVMLRWRAISQVARIAFPETIGGMYVAGELGDPVKVEGDNLVVDHDAIEAQGKVVPPPQPTALFGNGQSSQPTDAERRSTLRPADDPEAKDRAMKRIHVVGAKVGITHEILHEKAVQNGKMSVADYTTSALNNIADRIERSPADQLFNEWSPYGWLPPAPAADPETGEVIDVTPSSQPAPTPYSEDAHKEAKAQLWEAAKSWGWSIDDLACVAEYTCEGTLANLPTHQYIALLTELSEETPQEREAELRAAREALGRVA